MRLDVLGSSGGCPSRGNPASGYLVTEGDTRVWLDAGSGTFAALASLVDPGTVDGVVISHIHADHCVDLFGFFGYMAYGPSGSVPVPVYLPEGASDHFASFLRASDDHLFRVLFDLRTVGAGDTAQIGEISLRFASTNHPVPTIATRLEAAGASLAYSADTGPGGGYPELSRGVDLMLCEASMQGERTSVTYEHHLNAREAAGLALESEAARLVLTHVSPTLDGARSLDEATEVLGSPPALAMPGMVFDV